MKKTIFLFLIFLPLLLFAQHSQSSNKTASKGSGSAFGGKTEIDSVKYTEFRVIPEFKIWKLGIGLDLDFLLDHNYHLRKSDWDQLKDIPSKFYYIKYQKRGDPFYAQLGSLSGYGYSNGLVMMNYSNNRLFPDLKNTAFMAGGNPNILTKPSFEAMTSSIEKNQILAFNTHFKPVPDSTVKYLDRTVLGLTIATDRNQYGNLKYVASDSLYHAYKEKENAVTAFSFDYSLPVSKKREMTFGHYAEFSHIAGHGSGFIFPGFYGEYKFLKVNLEFRGYGPHYLPSFFDNRYEQTRAYQIGDSLVFTKEDMLKGIKSSSGWFGKVQISIKKKFKTSVAWQDMYGKDLQTGKCYWFNFWMDTKYHRLEEVAFAYSKTNVPKMEIDRIVAPSVDMSAKATVRVSKKRWFVIGSYSESYDDKNNNNKINYFKETRRSVAVGVKYVF